MTSGYILALSQLTQISGGIVQGSWPTWVIFYLYLAKASGGKSMLITKSDNFMVSNPTDDVLLNEAQYSRYQSVSKIHVVRCVVLDYKPVYWLVVKPPVDAQHGSINKQSPVCDVRCKTSINTSLMITKYTFAWGCTQDHHLMS